VDALTDDVHLPAPARCEAAQPEHGAHGHGPPVEGAPLGRLQSRAERQVGVARRVHKHRAPHGEPPLLGLQQDGVERAVGHSGATDEAVEQQAHAGLLDDAVGDVLERLRVEADAPLADGLLPRHGASEGGHPLCPLPAEPLDDGVALAGRVAEDGADEAGRCHAAHEAVALDQQRARAAACRRHRRRQPGRSRARHHHVRLGVHGHATGRFPDPLRAHHPSSPGALRPARRLISSKSSSSR